MSRIRLIVATIGLAALSACFGDPVINYTCDEPQLYQSVTASRKVVAPNGLDPLDEYAEMPIPRAEDAPERPPGSRCIELPPAIQAGS